jgi:tRNA threonylcarbamoyladenosine biosynthesis protein TsaB
MLDAEGLVSNEFNIEAAERPVLILSLDTTTRAGSIAILRGTTVLHEIRGDNARTHAQRLPTDLMNACAAAGVTIDQVDLFAVAAGPGSFTGLRVGIATIQGLAVARNRPVVPVSTLEAIVAAAGAPVVAAWMDAQRGEVFAQVFEHEDGVARARTEPISAPPGVALQLHQEALAGAEFHGDGAVRYRDHVLAARGPQTVVAPGVPPLAGAIGRIAARRAGQAVVPHAIVPIYVRRPDAEIARDRPQKKHNGNTGPPSGT